MRRGSGAPPLRASGSTLARAVAVAVAVGSPLAGCQAPNNPLLVEILLLQGDPVPKVLFVSVFDPHGAIVRRAPVAVSSLDGTLLLGGMPGDTPLRVGIVGGPSLVLGGATAEVPSGAQAGTVVALSATTPDQDADEVPDNIDNCPTIANPDQTDSNGNGTGDACEGLDLGGRSDSGPDAALDAASAD